MAPIRKGDGTGLGAEGYSEVRKGDGTVLWNAIPDSVVNNLDVWYAADEGGGTALNDSLETVDSTLPSDNWRDDANFWRGTAPVFDGVDERFTSDSTINVDSGHNGVVSVCFWLLEDTLEDRGVGCGFSNKPDINDGDGLIANLRTDGDVELAMASSGSATAGARVAADIGANELIFVGYSSDRSNTNLFVWDATTKIGADSDSSGNDWPTDDLNLVGGGSWIGDYLNGVIPASGFTFGNELTESDFQSIWEDTKP